MIIQLIIIMMELFEKLQLKGSSFCRVRQRHISRFLMPGAFYHFILRNYKAFEFGAKESCVFKSAKIMDVEELH